MVDVVTDIEIQRPLTKVAAFAGNPDTAPFWYVNIKYSNRLPPGTTAPLSEGSLIEFKAEFLGKKMAYTYKIVELTPTKMVMRTDQGPFPMETTYEWTPLEKDITRMSLRNRGFPVGFSKLFTPIMTTMMRKNMRKDLHLLKSILEGDQQL